MSAIAAIPLPAGKDFPDWVNPFVVKELRQGLSSRTFIGVFVMLHVCVMLAMMWGVLVDKFEAELILQWIVEAACVCLLLPLGAYFSIGDEVKADSLELIRVAGVTSGQMVMGKWQAQVCEAALLLVSVLPYHLMQYYLNHQGPLGQITLLYTCLLVSVVISAAMMFFATLRGSGKIGCVLIGAPLMLLPAVFLMAPLIVAMVQSSSTGLLLTGVVTVVFGAGLLFFLSLAVSGLDMRVRAVPQFTAPDWSKNL